MSQPPPPPSPEGAFSSLPEDCVFEVCRFLDLPSLLSLMGAGPALEALVRARPLCARALEVRPGGATAEALAALLSRVRRAGARLGFVRALRVARGGAPPLRLILESVASLPALRHVSLRGQRLSAAAVRALEGLRHVEVLDLGCCALEGGGGAAGAGARLRAPAWAPTIRALLVPHFREAAAWLCAAPALPRLAELAWGPWVSDAAVEALARRAGALAALTLEGVPLSVVGLAVSAEPWRSLLRRLRALSLLRCDLHPPAHLLRAPPPLAEALRAAPALQALRVVDPQPRDWAGGAFLLDAGLLRSLDIAGAWPRGLRALALSPAAAFCDEAAQLLAGLCPALEALALGTEEGGAAGGGGGLALGDRGAAALLLRGGGGGGGAALRALALPWAPRLASPPLGGLSRLQRASFSGCAGLRGGALAALLAAGAPLEELRLCGAHGAAEENAAALAALAARGCAIAYEPRVRPPSAAAYDDAPRFCFGSNSGAPAGRRSGDGGLLRGWFFEGGEPPPGAPHAATAAQRRAAAAAAAAAANAAQPAAAQPPHYPTPAAACAAAAEDAAAREASALCASSCPCPLQFLGCGFVAAAAPGAATARGGAIAHLFSGACAFASWACVACGGDVARGGGGGAAVPLCGAPACAAAAPRRACMPHVEGERRAALARGEEPRPPPKLVYP
jgi:hypothetical protein